MQVFLLFLDGFPAKNGGFLGMYRVSEPWKGVIVVIAAAAHVRMNCADSSVRV